MPAIDLSNPTEHLRAYHQHDAACKRLENVLREVDPYLIVRANKSINRYEIWRRNPSGSTTLALRIEGNSGEYRDPDEFGKAAVARLLGMQQPQKERIAAMDAHNERLRKAAQTKVEDVMLGVGEYLRPRIAAEEDGQAVRYPIEDVMQGVREAMGDSDPLNDPLAPAGDTGQ